MSHYAFVIRAVGRCPLISYVQPLTSHQLRNGRTVHGRRAVDAFQPSGGALFQIASHLFWGICTVHIV